MKLLASASYRATGDVEEKVEIDPGSYLEGLRLDDSGLMFTGVDEGVGVEGKMERAVGISVRVWEEKRPSVVSGAGGPQSRRGFVLCGFTKDEKRELGERELVSFGRFAARLRSTMEATRSGMI